MDDSHPGMSLEELLGRPLNSVEQKYAPPRVFVSGSIDILQKGFRVSVVGSRNATPNGLQRARKLARLICERGGVVVSGLAAGIDTAAHTAAIEGGGRTVAVIGTPLDKAYPRENADLQRQIMDQHLCITQFPVGYPTQPKNFPIRNRTMALVSDATVIVDAGQKSGSISQGWEALRLGRELFISKSLADNPKLTWPAEMTTYGARVLSNDSLEEFFETMPERDATFELDAIAF